MQKITEVGKFSQEIITEFGLSYNENDPIILAKNRKKHMLKRHGDEFADFEKTYSQIPDILTTSDYVGLHPDGKSLQFAKLLEENTLVAVRLDPKNGNVRTMYPLTDNKLKNYLDAKRMREM